MNMTVSTKVYTRNKMKMKYAFGTAIILIGILFLLFGIGGNEFAGFPSLGFWILFVGFIYMAIVTITVVSNREKIVDERMEHIGYRASRLTTLVLILFLFAVMIIDGIYTINVRYYLFSSGLICLYILTYLISYRMIERKS
jgi:drug/metabolite transporter (DMT)-like permease